MSRRGSLRLRLELQDGGQCGTKGKAQLQFPSRCSSLPRSGPPGLCSPPLRGRAEPLPAPCGAPRRCLAGVAAAAPRRQRGLRDGAGRGAELSSSLLSSPPARPLSAGQPRRAAAGESSPQGRWRGAVGLGPGRRGGEGGGDGRGSPRELPALGSAAWPPPRRGTVPWAPRKVSRGLPPAASGGEGAPRNGSARR